MKWMLIFLATICVAGCITPSRIDPIIKQYKLSAEKVELGDSKEKVLSILQPTQVGLPESASKSPDKYIKDGVKVEIYYMRSSRQPDGLTTDDEFMPYVFNNEKLVGIGWQVLGGPKTQGQATSDTYINNTSINKTNINGHIIH